MFDKLFKFLSMLTATMTLGTTIESIGLADDNLTLQDVCRLKGQEENQIHGLGLVVGLRGTGDENFKPTSRFLVSAMQHMGSQFATDAQGVPNLDEIKKAGNTAMVFISVEIPPTGAQQGDMLNCSVSSISAKNLEGGTLMLTNLLGPNRNDPTVYALAQGPLSIPDPRTPTSAVIHRGCKMETTVRNQFISPDNKVTLILEQGQSSFQSAQLIEDRINELAQSLLGGSPGNSSAQQPVSHILAHAIDQHHVEVKVPTFYRDRPVQFVALLMGIPITNIQRRKSVYINEREGVVAVGEDVLISPVVVSHKSLVIDTGSGARRSFVGVDPSNPDPKQQRPKLKNLQEALNELAVPTADFISIIKALKAKGDLFGEVIIQ